MNQAYLLQLCAPLNVELSDTEKAIQFEDLSAQLDEVKDSVESLQQDLDASHEFEADMRYAVNDLLDALKSIDVKKYTKQSLLDECIKLVKELRSQSL